MDVDVADIRNQAAFDLFSQIVPSRRYIVEPGAPGEAQRLLARSARPHTGARQERRAFVKRHTENCDHCLQRIDFRLMPRAQKGRNSDIWAVNARHWSCLPLFLDFDKCSRPQLKRDRAVSGDVAAATSEASPLRACWV